MRPSAKIPAFTLFGETEAFPDLIHVEEFAARAPEHGWRISAHRHGGMAQVFWVEDGHVAARVDAQDLSLESQSFLYIPVHCVHSFTFQANSLGLVLSLPLALFQTSGPGAESLRAALAKPIFGQAEPELVQIMDLVAKAFHSSGPFRNARIISLAQSLLAALAERALLCRPAHPAQGRSVLLALDQMIAQNKETGWTASDYAAQLAISTGHLSRLCRAATGLGATAYIEDSLMQEARRLLAFTQVPVAEVGYRLGFADPSYFSKRFRKSQGATPSDYRAQFAALGPRPA